MFTQIYSVTSVEEAQALVKCGVDSLGVNATTLTESSGFISIELALQIKNVIGDSAKICLLALENDPEVILEKARILKPDILHISGDTFTATKEFVVEVKKQLPFTKIMQAVQVADESAVTVAEGYSEFVDYLILDSGISSETGIGASGKTHDWNVSKKIVEICKIPIVLAGGLSPDNVYDAVKLVKPWGVDSLTKTDKILKDGRVVKDLDKVEQFCINSRKE